MFPAVRFALLLALAALAVVPATALSAPPSNDGYLQSIAINKPKTPLTQDQVKDARDTREATVQGDLFSPPNSGGGVESTDCHGTSFGATVWYDFHPHADGTVRVQATGYDAMIGIYEFDQASSRIGSRLDCSNEAGTTEELFVKVRKGKSYTIQIGGSGGAGGDLDFTFEYLSDRDGDGELDALDKCPDQPGTANGCPVELRVLPTLRATPTGRGIRVRSLSVDAPRGARVKVHCTHGCSFTQSRTVLTNSPLRFARLTNRMLSAGARLEITVTKSRSIGSFIRYSVTRGNFRRTVRCLRPGSAIPRRTCK